MTPDFQNTMKQKRLHRQCCCFSFVFGTLEQVHVQLNELTCNPHTIRCHLLTDAENEHEKKKKLKIHS